MTHNPHYLAAYQLATDLYVSRNDLIPRHVERAVDDMAKEFDNKTCWTVGDVAEWWLSFRLDKLRSYRA